MCRKSRFVNSILFRISAWILLFGIASILIITHFVKMQMRYNIERQVTEEMLRVRDNSEIYIRQLLLINNCRIDETGFSESGKEIQAQLKSVGYEETALYDLEGNPLESGGRRFMNAEQREDFKRAVKENSTFTVYYGRNNQCEVYFTMPVHIMGKKLGFISYFFDYQETCEREWNMFSWMIHITVSAFAAVCLVIWLMIYRIVSPIRRLSRITGEISLHLADGKLDDEIIEDLNFSRRKDEIGDLSQNYMKMLAVTKEQFEKIRRDKEHILNLWKSRQEFYNNVTHELKTPLTTISGYAQLIGQDGFSDRKLFRNGIEHILKESTRLHEMVVQLLEMQDKENPEEIKLLNLSEILRNVAEMMQIKARRYESCLALEGVEDTYLTEGREDKIRQVLINVIDNAIKYGKPKEEILLQIYRQKGFIMISVSNKGQGIKKEDLDNIFEPFYRVDKEKGKELGSSGLGLAISKKIMEEHAGSIRAESEPGVETVFTVSFPDVGK